MTVALRVVVRAEDEDVATALLWESGTDGIQVLSGRGGEAELIAYFQERPGLSETVGQSFSRLPHAWIEATDVPDVDWVARFREGFRGFACGGFWIAPAWDVPTVRLPGRRLLIVDPGRAFGTGTHETTRLCLAALEALSPPRDPAERLLDLGTGTGILAVAGALLGWQRVVACDVDPECMEAVRLHARLNGVEIRPALADGGAAFAARTFAVVVANLSAPLLVQRCSEIGGLAAPGGSIVLSGLLASDMTSVAGAYSAAGRVVTSLDGEWAQLTVHVPP